MQQYLTKCIEQKKLKEAEEVKNSIIFRKQKLRELRMNFMVMKQENEKKKVQDMFNEELEALQKAQHDQLYATRNKLLEKEKQIMEKHSNEIEKHKYDLEINIMKKFKPSKDLLNSMNIYNKLLKQGRYGQADQLKTTNEETEKKELENWNSEKDKKIKNELKNLEVKQCHEIEAFKTQTKKTLDEVQIVFLRQRENLFKKYNNLDNLLKSNHGLDRKKMEGMIKNNKSINSKFNNNSLYIDK
eukprot:Mrub_07781.p1 GENE.Mrub_07781~~Mrub_07781.p1  ORF type:complete len:266 (+),score=66.48 Mrub_07781:70-798(+)